MVWLNIRIYYSYIAGFFDGEGSPCLSYQHTEKKYSKKISVRISIPNTDKATLIWMREKMNNIGNIFPRPSVNKQCWDWSITRMDEILYFSEKISPFTKNNLKKRKFDILIRYCKLRLWKMQGSTGTRSKMMQIGKEEFELVKEFVEVGC